MTDRGFIGQKWFQILNKRMIPYFIRVKENTLLPWGKATSIQAKKLFYYLKECQNRLIIRERYGETVYLAGVPSKSGELVIVLTDQNLKASQILSKYPERWSIEESFSENSKPRDFIEKIPNCFW